MRAYEPEFLFGRLENRSEWHTVRLGADDIPFVTIPIEFASMVASFNNLRVTDGVLDAIGGTPLVRLRRYLDRDDVTLYCKMECCNPGGSAKDRPAHLHLD